MKNYQLSIFFFTLLCLASIDCWAGPVSESQALQTARRFYASPALRAPGKKAAPVLAFKLADAKGEPQVYVFGKGENQQGFVVVAGDDRVPAVLGYSDEGQFQADDMPSNMRAWLDEYARQINYLRSHPAMENRREATRLATAVGPLLGGIEWDQLDPYNKKCPNGYPTGCVATAMGQVMYYHKYPEHGNGSKSYNWNGRTLSANFGNTTYQWDKMANKVTKDSPADAQEAVSTLLYHVGVSLSMNYDDAKNGGSGASPSYIAESFVKYFGYDKGVNLRSREYFTSDEWWSLLQNEFDHGRPVLYGGFTASASGHSFVADGYNQEGYVHINWGWSGVNNGYFLLSALNPKTMGTGGGAQGEGYNYNQTMVIGIQKPAGSKMAYSVIFKNVDDLNTTIEGTKAVTLSANRIHTDGIDPLTLQLRFEVFDADGKSVCTSSTTQKSIDIGESTTAQCSLSLPANMADGTYKAYLTCHINNIDEDGVFNRINYMVGENGYYLITVSGSQRTIKSAGKPALALKSLTVNPNPIEGDKPFTVTAVISNTGGEYDGRMAYQLVYPEDNDHNYYAPEKELVVREGETTTLEFTDCLSLLSNDHYTLQLMERVGINHVPFGNPITIKVNGDAEPYSLSATDYLDFEKGADNVKRDNINITANLKNDGGLFEGRITCLIFTNANAIVAGKQVASLDTVDVQIAKRSSGSLTLHGSWPGAVDGQTYYAALYNVSGGAFITPTKYAQQSFTIRDDASGEPSRLYLKEQIGFEGGNSNVDPSNMTLNVKVLNTGAPYNGNFTASFYKPNGWQALATMSQTAEVGYDDIKTIQIKGSTTALEQGKKYNVGLVFGDNEESSWLSYALHPNYSNVDIVVGNGTSGITEAAYGPADEVSVYNMAGILVAKTTEEGLQAVFQQLPHGQYVARGKNSVRKIAR